LAKPPLAVACPTSRLQLGVVSRYVYIRKGRPLADHQRQGTEKAGVSGSTLSESGFIVLKDLQDFCGKADVFARKFYKDQFYEGSKPLWGWSFL